MNDWRDSAHCRGGDPEIFFPIAEAQAWRAKVVCADCPVRQKCLDYAIKTGDENGVWGGLSEKERRHIRKQTTGLKAHGSKPRTHCPHRHRYTDANSWIDPEGYRRCRQCANGQAAIRRAALAGAR